MEELGNIIKICACFSLMIGAVECFAGFKIMKVMTAIWGFFLGAATGVGVAVLTGSPVLGVATVVILGTLIAVLSFKLYLAGVFIMTALLAAATFFIISQNAFTAILLGVCVGAVAVFFVKPLVICTTAISGAGTILSSAYAIMSLQMSESPVVTVILWIPIALSGIAVQYVTTRRIRAEKSAVAAQAYSPAAAPTFSERKYPGMQRAYRNFCIKCGCELFAAAGKCPRCGYDCDD